jgi:hypothetical protein
MYNERKLDKITHQEWLDQFKIICDEDGSPVVYETYGLDHEHVRRNYKRAWTLVDTDLPYPVVTSGMSFVNRICYYLGEVNLPNQDSLTIEVIEESNYPVVGEKVWWRDPDDNISSGVYTIKHVVTQDEVYRMLSNETLSEVEVYRHELEMFTDLGECFGCGKRCYEAAPCEYLKD